MEIEAFFDSGRGESSAGFVAASLRGGFEGRFNGSCPRGIRRARIWWAMPTLLAFLLFVIIAVGLYVRDRGSQSTPTAKAIKQVDLQVSDQDKDSVQSVRFELSGTVNVDVAPKVLGNCVNSPKRIEPVPQTDEISAEEMATIPRRNDVRLMRKAKISEDTYLADVDRMNEYQGRSTRQRSKVKDGMLISDVSGSLEDCEVVDRLLSCRQIEFQMYRLPRRMGGPEAPLLVIVPGEKYEESYNIILAAMKAGLVSAPAKLEW